MEDLMDKTLRWMAENLDGAQKAVYAPEHEKAGRRCTNSGTGLIACCYINALGKVLLKGQPGDPARFKKFVTECMQDFLQAGSTKALPPTPKGGTGGEDWRYHIFRCGFVHGFYPPGGAWGRSESGLYWLSSNPPTLNIDRLVRGFTDGVEIFRQKAVDDPDIRVNFGDYITR